MFWMNHSWVSGLVSYFHTPFATLLSSSCSKCMHEWVWSRSWPARTQIWALFDLEEADYDAEVCFSDGTTMPLNLNIPTSIIKCFSGFTFFRKACLKIYEEGDLALGGDPCYETCDSESCIAIEPIPFELAEALIPDLSIHQATCSIEADDLPGSIESKTQVMIFNSAFPGGDDAAAFISAFLDGEDFANQASFQTSGTSHGSYSAAACGYVLDAPLTHAINYCEDDTTERTLQQNLAI